MTTWKTTGTPSLPPLANNIGGLTQADVTFDVVPHDYDQDGVTDLLFSDPAGGEITWLRSPPQGGFTSIATGIFIPTPIPANHRVTASTALYADVDGDGVADLIQCNELPVAPGEQSRGDWQVRRWSPGDSGTPAGFGAPENIALLNQRGCNLKRYMHLIDLDGDGKTELVVPPSGYTREEAQPQASPQCFGLCLYSSLQWSPPSVGGAPGWTITATELLAPDWSLGSGRVLFLDVNGDGLPDALTTGDASAPGLLMTSMNTGRGFLPGVPSLPGYPPDQGEYLDFSATLDFDGDGRMDLLLPMKYGACLPYSGKSSCWVVLKSSPFVPGAFELVPVHIPFSDEIDHVLGRLQPNLVPRITDINGDGRADVVMPIDGTFQVFINEGPRDLLHTVTDGMNPLDPGDSGFLPDVAIEYGAVLDHAKTAGIDPTSSAAESETYLPRTDALNTCAYPRTCVVGSKRVVSAYTLNNGQNQARAFTMRYRDGRAHRLGRGFLGFGTVLTTEDSQRAGRAEAYDNVTFDDQLNTFPFTGALVRSWSWVPEVAGPWNKIAFSYTDRVLEKRFSVYSAGVPRTYFTLPTETRQRKSEDLDLLAGAGETLLEFVAEHAASPQGDLLDTTERITGYDNYGNVLTEERATASVDDFRTVERHADNDASAWLLGEVTKEVACSSALGDTKCRTTVRTYNARGEVETEGRGDPAEPETTRNTTFARDNFGNLTLVTADDAFGNHRSACITYEKEGIFPYAFSRAVGQVSRVAFDAGLGAPTALKDANGLTTVWQHDAFGRTTKETGADGVVTDLGVQRLKNGGPTHTWYALYPDTTIAGAFRQGQELDSRGRTVRSWAYGPHVAAQNGMNQSTHPLYEEDTTYDLLGRVAQRSKPWMIGDPAGSQLYTQYAYDTLGRTLSVKSPWGYTTRYDYSGNTVVTTMPAAGTMLATTSTTDVDPLGRTILVTDAKLGTTATTYGPFGEPRVVASPSGLFVTVRDAYGRVTKEIDPDRGTTNIHYNGFDEQSQVVDAANRVVEYVYDSLGRRTQRRDNGALSTTWHYDDPVKGYGRLADVTSTGGATKSYAYDPKGRVSSVALLLGGETFTSQYHHDASGNIDTITYPQGPGGAQFRIRNEYDEDDNLTGVRDDIDANHPYFWRLTRVNGVGQTSQEIFGNNEVVQGHALVTERDYFTDTGALKAIRTTAGSTSVQNLAYSYDARLNLTARTDALQLGVNAPKTERFGYDELDRLTTSNLNIACSPPGSCNDHQVLTYAADGNIATKSDVAGGAKYAYDVASSHPHAVASIGALAYGYNTVGNQTSRPGLTIDYTPFDLPKKYTRTSGGPTPTTFEYDGDQTRVRKTTPGDETVYAGAYERVTHFGMQAAATEHRYYVSSNERVVAVVTRTSLASKTVYLHVDHLGSTDVITDGGAGLVLGTVKERRSYDAFGAKRNPVWGAPGSGGAPALTTLGFTSHESEGEFDLVNMKGRMFDPKVGRFLTTDPLVSHPGFSQSWNPYSYVLNNPLKYVDPTGFEGYATTTPDDSSHTGVTYVLPGDIDVVNPTPGFPGNAKLVDQINHDVPPALQGDADLPAGDPLSPPAEPLKDQASVQEAGGFLSGIALGYVPGASLAAQAAINAGLISEGTRFARIGRGAGEMVGGFAAVLTGGGGLVAGGGASGTGVGALVGVPVLVGSAVLAVGGVANVAVGGRGMMAALMSKGYNDNGEKIARGGREPRETKAGANSADKKQIDDAARRTGITDRRGFGDYVEELKGASGRGGRDNFTWDELLEIAQDFRSAGGK